MSPNKYWERIKKEIAEKRDWLIIWIALIKLQKCWYLKVPCEDHVITISVSKWVSRCREEMAFGVWDYVVFGITLAISVGIGM